MKITKKQPVTASEEVAIVDVPVVAEDPAAVVVEESVATPCDCKYACAIDYISNAIECLAEIAKDDQVAKDSIANLGVVLLDLKSAC